jgi:hypothetical protein
MKNLARMTLFFSFCFILTLALAAASAYLKLWIGAARLIPAQPLEGAGLLISLGRRSLPIALYSSLLLSLSYTLRREIPKYMAMSFLFILAYLSTAGLSLGFHRLKPAERTSPSPVIETLGKPGLILSQGDAVTVFLGEPADPQGARVISLPDRPLIYQESSPGPVNPPRRLPQAPFKNEDPSIIFSLLIDFSLATEQFELRMGQSLLSFSLYLGSLCILLVSLRFIFEISAWPLANLFIGALLFRGALALEVFLDSEEIQSGIGYFAGKLMPPQLISPSVFCILAIVLLLYTALIARIRNRRSPDA